MMKRKHNIGDASARIAQKSLCNSRKNIGQTKTPGIERKEAGWGENGGSVASRSHQGRYKKKKTTGAVPEGVM